MLNDLIAGSSPKTTSAWSASCFFLCFLTTLACTWFADYALVNHDMAAIMTSAQQVLRGRKLYADIITSQFPFIIYLMMVPLGIHALTGLPVPEAFTLFVFLTAQAGALLAWRIALYHPRFRGFRQRYILLLTFDACLFVLPLLGDRYYVSFGQREHLFCALALPYFMLAINRLEGVGAGRKVLFATGVMAGFAFCIKPHFLILFMLAELFQWKVSAKFFALRRLDARIILLLTATYLLGMIFFMPDYFALIPHLTADYRGYQAGLPVVIFSALLSFIPPLAVTIAMRRSPDFRILLFLLTLITGSEIIYIAALAVYSYHAIPIYFFSLLLLVFLLLGTSRVMGACLALPLFFVYVGAETAFPYDVAGHREDVLNEAALLNRYKSICFLNTGIQGFPDVLYTQAEWELSMPLLEYLPTAYAQFRHSKAEPPYRAPDKMGDNEHFFHEKIIADLERLPDAIVIGEGPLDYMNPRFNLLHYFGSDPRFGAIMAHYELTDKLYRKHYFNAGVAYDAIYRRKQ